MTWATSVPILVFPGLSVLDLGRMYATDRQTASSLGAGIITLVRSATSLHLHKCVARFVSDS